MLINAIDPYWWNTQNMYYGLHSIPRIDVGGIPILSTNAVALTDTSVDYGINPCAFNRLPVESVVLLTINADVPDGGAALPAALVIPNGGNSTVTPTGSTTGTRRIQIVDSQGNNVTGANIQGNTQRLAYINKNTGIIRFLEFTNATA